MSSAMPRNFTSQLARHPLAGHASRAGRIASLVAAVLVGSALLGSTPGIAATAAAEEQVPAGVEVVRLIAQPEEVNLQHAFDYRQLLLLGLTADGQTVDLTRIATLEMDPDAEAAVIEVSPQRTVTPLQAGATELAFRYGSLSLTIPVTVSGLDEPYHPGFVSDVQPVISRLGCNQGTCHGSKDGQNGFKLSLRGYDAIYDYRALTDDISGRRFNRAAPDQSLMLLKASGAIPHVGGGLTQPGERYYEIIRRWIAGGVQFDGETAAKVTHIEISPQNPFVPRAGMRQQITVQAFFDNGTSQDVTHEAFIESGNIEVAEAENGGVVRLLRRGEAPVLVRYEGAYAATTLTVMGDRSGFGWSNPPEFNYVDQHVYSKLKNVKVQPSELCTDAEFIRRVYLDLTGLLPSAEQVREFLDDARETQDKRQALVDRLIGSPEYVEHWTNKWADLLQVNQKFLGREGAVAFRAWIKQSIAENKPYNQFAREILTASGSTLENPPAAYYKVLRNPVDIMENTTHLFLAVRFNCNKCHDHPFERWTQDQYYELAAYFGQVQMKEDPVYAGQKIGGSAVEGAKPLVEVVYDANSGEVVHDRTGENAPPSFPYTHEAEIDPGAPRREQLANWLTSPNNRYFARSLVNRMWGYMFGRGIIEPIDDIRAGNPPTNPPLLAALEEDFIANGFDVQHVLRTICTSRTYQHSYQTNEWNADDTINYSHAMPQRLTAEMLFDAIHLATGAPFNIPGAPGGFRAAELPDAGVQLPFLADFGKPSRESACECERSSGMVLGPVMKLVNGPTVANSITHPQNAIHRLLREHEDDRVVIEEMFLRFLARYPTEREIELGLAAIENAGADLPERQQELAAYETQLPELQATWEARLQQQVSWQSLVPTKLNSEVGAEFRVSADVAVAVSGANGKDTYTIRTEWPSQRVTGLRLEALASPQLPEGGPGRAKNGNFVLSEIEVTAISKANPEQRKQLKLVQPQADFSQESWPVVNTLDGNPATGWAVMPQFNQSHTALFNVSDGELFEGGTLLEVKLVQHFPDGTHTLGAFRLSATDSTGPINFRAVPAELAEALSKPAAERSDEEQQLLRNAYLKTDARYQELVAAVARSQQEQENRRLIGMQDLAWALINNPSFLFNR